MSDRRRVNLYIRESSRVAGGVWRTAETHRAKIMKRLDCHSVSELVRYAVRNNIIEA